MNASRRRAARAELEAAVDALTRIGALVVEGHERYKAEEDRRAHLRYLWIVVGSRLKNHAEALRVPRSAGAFAHAIAFRHVLAYRAPSQVDDELVWTTSVEDAPVLAEEIAATITALP